MTDEETIELETLGEEGGFLPNWDDLKGYVGLHFEDIEVYEGEEKLEFKEGKESPYALTIPIHYGESIYTVYFKNHEALYEAVDLLKKEYQILRAGEVDDEQEDINKMSKEGFEEWRTQKGKSWEEAQAKRELEQDAQRRAWIEEHGSKKLKRILEEGRNYEKRYLVEKGAHLLGKEYVIDYKRELWSDFRHDPSPAAIEEADKLKKQGLKDARVVWLRKGRCEAVEAEVEGVRFYKKLKPVRSNIVNSPRTRMILFMKDGVPHSWDEAATEGGVDTNRILYALIERGWVYKNSTEHGSRYTLNLKNREVSKFLAKYGLPKGMESYNKLKSKTKEQENLEDIKLKCELCRNNAEWKLDMDDGKITYLCASDYDKIIEMAGNEGIEDVVAVTKLKSEIKEKIETPKKQEIETPIKWKCVAPDCKKDGVWELGATSEDAKKFWGDHIYFALCAEHFEEFSHDDNDMELFQAFSRLKKRRL